jgi:hypothetical protein
MTLGNISLTLATIIALACAAGADTASAQNGIYVGSGKVIHIPRTASSVSANRTMRGRAIDYNQSVGSDPSPSLAATPTRRIGSYIPN